jgi:chloride channel protein, CIC family
MFIMRKKIIQTNYVKLVFASVFAGLLSAFLASVLKHITEHYEEHFFQTVSAYSYLFLVFPLIGLLLIHVLRKYAFRKKPNKGIKEIYLTLDTRRNELPSYKIPSHFINGFLTVVFGGSTGVEVSTVVSTATIGAVTRQKANIANRFKTELICAGVAGGLTALFGSPLVGLLFAVEVIARKVTKTILLSTVAAVLVAWGFLQLFHEEPLLKLSITHWEISAIPYIIGLSILAGIISVFFTRTVIAIKRRFGSVKNEYIRILAGAAIIGIGIFILPALFGDSYKGVSDMIGRSQHESFTIPFALTLLAIVLLKPVISSVTLGVGGDGGVFAPSIVMGALLGLLLATFCNHYFHSNLIVANFIIMGIAAVLSGSIHAPLTSTSLACRLSGGFILAVPVLIASTVARYTAKKIYPYTVYSYKDQAAQ